MTRALEKLQLKIGGMACSFCAETIGKGLGRTDGVADVNVSLAHEEALIAYDHERVTPAALTATLRSLGYTVRDPKKARTYEGGERGAGGRAGRPDHYREAGGGREHAAGHLARRKAVAVSQGGKRITDCRGWARRWALGAALAAALLMAGSAGAFPVNAPNARTLFGGFTLGSFRLRVTEADTLKAGPNSVTDPKDQALTTYEEDVTFVWGVTRDLTLSVTQPIVERRLRFDGPAGERRTIRADGPADLTLVGAYRVFRKDAYRATTQLSLLGGLKLPSGATDIEDSNLPRLTGQPGTRLPPNLQLGSGSVDGIVGLAAFHNMDRLSFYADVQGKLNTEGAQDVRAGHSVFYDLSADYVLLPQRNLFLILELNGVSTSRASQAGRTVRDSGGQLLFISPGIQYLPIPNLILEGSVQVPIHRDLNGRQLAPDWSAVVGLRYLF